MTDMHPDNLPDAVPVSPYKLGDHKKIVERLFRAGCAVRYPGAVIEVYVPQGYTDDDMVALTNDLIDLGYVIVGLYDLDDDFWTMLEIIPIGSSAYVPDEPVEKYSRD